MGGLIIESKEKSTLTKLGNTVEFKNVIEKLTLGLKMNFQEKSYILSCALIFLQEYQKDKRLKTFLEFSYYIILKYSVQYNDYLPLYDFSINNGLYPISKFIRENKLVDNISIINEINNIAIDKHYSHKDYVETLEQNKIKKNILISEKNEISFVAPTSFGKSTLIIEHIKLNLDINRKIGIIVPTKSLLMQTYRLIKESNLNCKIIIHDEMYNNDKQFIGILTQERALRLIENSNIYFDILYIDEAHNLFNDDSRNILLARLIRKNKKINCNQKVIYLSPLIFDSNNLKFQEKDYIYEQKIDFNIKEPEYFEYRTDKKVYKFNRFVGQFYKIGEKDNIFEYFKSNYKEKNFFYLYRPKIIEKFSNLLYECLPKKEITKEIQDLIDILNKYVHKDFYANKLISKGIIYLHGKLPDYVKEYLEYKYKNIPELKYLIANNVILEGMNLPIDTLFILNTYRMNEKRLTNLIGRVNRLNNVFNDDTASLSKLLPDIHFVNSNQWNRNDSSMEAKIKSLRVNRFKDIIENPTLLNFDFQKLKIDKKSRASKMEVYREIKEYEDKVLRKPINEFEKAKIKFIEYGIEKFYKNFNDELNNRIYRRLKDLKLKQGWESLSIIDKIYYIFIYNIEGIKNFEISRLKEKETRNYYEMFMNKKLKSSFNELINWQFAYFKNLIKKDKSKFYIGSQYGEIPKETKYYQNPLYNVYIDLSTKRDVELVNLAIVKIKMEEDFISFNINRLLNLMLDFQAISEKEFNLAVYGTNDKKVLSLLKMGLPLNILIKLSEDNQIKNVYLDHYNNLKCNQVFQKYLNTLDDFYRFQIEKFI